MATAQFFVSRLLCICLSFLLVRLSTTACHARWSQKRALDPPELELQKGCNRVTSKAAMGFWELKLVSPWPPHYNQEYIQLAIGQPLRLNAVGGLAAWCLPVTSGTDSAIWEWPVLLPHHRPLQPLSLPGPLQRMWESIYYLPWGWNSHCGCRGRRIRSLRPVLAT